MRKILSVLLVTFASSFSHAASYWSLPVELLYTPFSKNEIKETSVTNAYDGSGYEGRVGVEVLFLNVSAFMRKSTDERKEIAGIKQEMQASEYGLLLRIQPTQGLYLGGGYGLLDGTITDSGASTAERKVSGHAPLANVAIHFGLGANFKFLLDGTYKFASKTYVKDGENLDALGDISGWRASAGIAVLF